MRGGEREKVRGLKIYRKETDEEKRGEEKGV